MSDQHHWCIFSCDHPPDKPPPHTWSLPPEPGPEVKAVRSRYGLFVRETPNPVDVDLWAQQEGTGAGYGMSWAELLSDQGQLTDASEEVE